MARRACAQHPLSQSYKKQSTEFQNASYFLKIDLKNGYHPVRIKEGDEWKTAFRCRYGLFEYTVMPFGLINAPATFQAMINHIFRDMLDQGTIAFMDDISVHHATLDGHNKILHEVLTRLQDNGLCIAPEKCVWVQDRIKFLGYIVSGDGAQMTDEYVRSVKEIKPRMNGDAPLKSKQQKRSLSNSSPQHRC